MKRKILLFHPGDFVVCFCVESEYRFVRYLKRWERKEGINCSVEVTDPDGHVRYLNTHTSRLRSPNERYMLVEEWRPWRLLKWIA